MHSPARYAVIGHPVNHSRSPFIHALFAQQTGQHLVYDKIEVLPENVERDVRQFFAGGGRGLNVTVPHKQAVAPLCNRLTPRAQLAGAVNTLAMQGNGELLGDNTDGTGLVADLRKNLHVRLRGARILLIGAGGAARGVIAPLLEQAPACLHVINRTADKATALAQEFSKLGPVSGGGLQSVDGKHYDILINATAASLQGDVPAVPAGALSGTSVCYDMVYGNDATPFMRWAKKHGAARAESGIGMLVEQAAESFYLWRGIRPDTMPVLAALRAPPR